MKREKDHRGFTLVELLVVMVVIAILAAGALFVLFKAETYGKEAFTRGQIVGLHRVVMDSWENYAIRPLNVAKWDPATETSAEYEARKKAAFDAVMAMDFPNRWDEITGTVTNPISSADRTGPSRAYQARLIAKTTNPNTSLQAAECLYLIVSMSTNGLDRFFDKNHFDEEGRIGDTDGDKAPEFLDGWGRPIFFLRAPVGFPSTLNEDQANNPMFLIYSPGPDKRYGLNVDPNAHEDPSDDTTPLIPIGTPVTDNPHHYMDNIHNHQVFE